MTECIRCGAETEGQCPCGVSVSFPKTLISPTDWVHRWMRRAEELASWSKDPSTKVGCVLVHDRHSISEGFNGFPHGADDAPALYLERSLKYERTVHAEANAVAHAARYGIPTKGALAFCTFPTCPPCAGLLIQAGISGLYVKMPSCKYCDWYHNQTSLTPNHQRCGPRRVLSLDKNPVMFIHDVRTLGGREVVPCTAPIESWVARFNISRQLFTEACIPVTTL